MRVRLLHLYDATQCGAAALRHSKGHAPSRANAAKALGGAYVFCVSCHIKVSAYALPPTTSELSQARPLPQTHLARTAGAPRSCCPRWYSPTTSLAVHPGKTTHTHHPHTETKNHSSTCCMTPLHSNNKAALAPCGLQPPPAADSVAAQGCKGTRLARQWYNVNNSVTRVD